MKFNKSSMYGYARRAARRSWSSELNRRQRSAPKTMSQYHPEYKRPQETDSEDGHFGVVFVTAIVMVLSLFLAGIYQGITWLWVGILVLIGLILLILVPFVIPILIVVSAILTAAFVLFK